MADVLGVLERVVPVAARAARLVRSYALVAGVAALIIAAFLFRNGAPDDGNGWAVAIVGTLLAAAPPVILFVFSAALRALSELPARIRELPASGREHASAFARLAGEAREARGRRGLVRLPVLLWRLAKLSDETRGLLTPYAPVLPLASVPFLVLTGAATFAAMLEIWVALVLLIVLAVT